MGKIRRKFDAEFKRKVVSEIANGMTRTAAARKYDISPSVIQKWLDKVSEGTEFQDAPSKRERELERENQELKAKIGELVMEVDVLKKMELYAQRLKKLNTSVITASNLDQFKRPVK